MRSLRTLFLCSALFLLVVMLRLSAFAEAPVYRSVETDTKKIALTFDDGPHPTLTPKILEILGKYNVKATFFMVGENVVNYPESARMVLREGHEIGNHTYTHRHVAEMDEETLKGELGRCEDALLELCEYRTHLFRPPEGAVTPCVERCSEEGDYSLILWSLDTRDWEHKSASRIASSVLDGVHPGDIILMHDYIGVKSKTPEALEVLIPELLRRGYELVTVSDLMGIR